jgi:hypothetical protein
MAMTIQLVFRRGGVRAHLGQPCFASDSRKNEGDGLACQLQWGSVQPPRIAQNGGDSRERQPVSIGLTLVPVGEAEPSQKRLLSVVPRGFSIDDYAPSHPAENDGISCGLC